MKEATMGLIEVNQTTASQVAESILQSGGYYLVYEKDGDIRGWLGVSEYFNAYAKRREAIIAELYVQPNDRKKGIAKRLVDFALQEFKMNGYQKVHIHVYKGNPALRLYEQFGFQEISTMLEKK